MTPAEKGAALARRRAAKGAHLAPFRALAMPADRKAAHDEARDRAQQLRQALKSGVQVVSAPQLFPTPPDLAARMVEEADIQPGMRVMEPSAGTGRLLDAIAQDGAAGEVVAVEISPALAGRLDATSRAVVCGDFLRCTPETIGLFDRIVMNPPFGGAQDIQHIRHALLFLKPGGRLVALCAAGPRQRAAFEHLGYWEILPPNTFVSEGTGVNAALLVAGN